MFADKTLSCMWEGKMLANVLTVLEQEDAQLLWLTCYAVLPCCVVGRTVFSILGFYSYLITASPPSFQN